MDLFSIEKRNNPYSNGTVSSPDFKSAEAGVTGGYNGSSFTILVLIVFFPGLSMYNAIELLVLILFTFKQYKGWYFWSLLIASIGVIPYSLGFLLKFGNIVRGEAIWLSVVLLTIGWWTMVTGQSVVLWSRLHLILEGEKGRKTLVWTKWMIIINAIILHIPTTVLTFGSNGHSDTREFAHGYNIMEKIQMSGFFLQEVILSSIYIIATLRILKTSVRAHTKRLMWQLMGINIIIIILDLALLSLEAASLYLLETLLKGVIYSVKLKLEFAILGQLVQFVGRPGTSIANDERTRRASAAYFGNDADEKTSRDTLGLSEPSGFGPGFISDFAELSKLRTQHSHSSPGVQSPDDTKAAPPSIRERTRTNSVRLPPGMTMGDVNLAMFQHTGDTSLGDLGSDIEERPPGGVVPTINEQKTKTGDGAV